MSIISYTFTVNGIERTTDEKKPLLRYLRDDLKLYSVKDGCSEGACGTCTIVVDGHAVKACVLTTDKAVGKNTTVVIFGRKAMGWCYLLSGVIAMLLMCGVWAKLPPYSLAAPLLYLVLHVATWRKITATRGAALNPLLGETARNLLIFTLLFLGAAIIA